MASPPKPMELAPQLPAPAASTSSATPETASAVPGLPAPTPAEMVRVEQRLKDSLTSEMLANFDLFLYVSKADSGPWSQRMFVFQKQANGDLVLFNDWPVSTGREKIEFNAAGAKLPSFTPAGYYELDSKRFYPHYRSMQWNEPMPYAMFFNWVKDGNPTGLAIHAASGNDVAMLGSRASAGCVRLPPEAARQLFTLIRTQYHGLAPRFAMDRRTGTMSNERNPAARSQRQGAARRRLRGPRVHRELRRRERRGRTVLIRAGQKWPVNSPMRITMGIGTPSSTNRHDLIRHPIRMSHKRQWATPEGVPARGRP